MMLLRIDAIVSGMKKPKAEGQQQQQAQQPAEGEEPQGHEE